MIVSMIAAAAENNVIGKDNDLPWDLPADMQFFRDTTRGHPIIMGRKNYESIGRPLPGRRNIVVTRQEGLEIEGCDVVQSLQAAIDLAKEEDTDEIFIIGGGQIYREGMTLADRIYLTRIHAEIEGDVHFPEISEDAWEEVGRREYVADEENEHAMTFLTYEKK